MNWPNPLSNATPFGSYINSLLRKCRSSELVSVVGGRLSETTNGKTLVIDVKNTQSSSSGMVFRGVWAAGSYDESDVVVIQSGAAAGTYVSMTGANTNNPATGVNWLQISPGNTVGNWT